MGTPWTDESAILRDLSFAQGRWVPGGINSAVAGAKPPAHNIKEETEEEFYQRWASVECGGTGDFSTGPDLYHIKTMLELVQDEEAPEETPYTSGPIEITKLNVHAKPFAPKQHKSKENIKPPNKPQRARNVAIASIMALALTQESPKLAKPEDFIKCKEDNEVIERRKDSVNKVTNWLQSQDISSMFKKKSSIQSFKEVQRSSKTSPSQSEPEDSAKSPSGQYTPSRWAAEYYERACDRGRVRDLVREDVWGRAERIMKEIDAQREIDALEELRKQKEAAELAAEQAERNEDCERDEAAGEHTAPALALDDDETEGIAKILLPLSRHSLQRVVDCQVCKVLCAPKPSEQKHAPSPASSSEYTLLN